MLNEFNDEAEYVSVSSYLTADVWETIGKQVSEDGTNALFAASLIVIYCVLFLGACSPIHCKFSLTIVGLICIALSVFVGGSIAVGWGY